MAVNDDLDLGIDLTPETLESAPAPPKKGKGKEIDPEDDRENWPTITIDSEDGKPNYEYLAIHGTKKNGQPFDHELQVMREVEVKVPPSIVYMLRSATATHYSQRRNADGKMELVPQKRASIPWRLVDGGKYIK